MSVHCMIKPLVMQILLLPFRQCQIVDLAVGMVVLGSYVCLVTLALL